LIIAHASSRPGVPERYSYVGALAGIGCTVVFLRAKEGYFFGLDPDDDEEMGDESVRCQEFLRSELGVERENVISVGGSAGGVRALRYAVQLGHGHAIVGAPLVMVGDFLLDPTGGKGARKKIARTISGGIDDDARDRLNHVIVDHLMNPAGETSVHLFISERDEMYQHSLPPLEEACRANPDSLHLDLTIGTYVGHSQHREHFRTYLRTKAVEVLDSIDRPEVRSEVTASA
jgi:hypothetical protein